MMVNDTQPRINHTNLHTPHSQCKANWDLYLSECTPSSDYRNYLNRTEDDDYAVVVQFESLAAQQTWRRYRSKSLWNL